MRPPVTLTHEWNDYFAFYKGEILQGRALHQGEKLVAIMQERRRCRIGANGFDVVDKN